jgi:hypothetical protein
MADLFDYLSWRGDLTFRQSPFNPVDNIILTHVSYLPLDNIVPGIEENKTVTVAEAAEAFGKAILKNPDAFEPFLISKEDPDFLDALSVSARFRDMGLSGFVNQIDPDQEKQFAALAIFTRDDSSFITYRGTDNSLVGWKEDLNMTFTAEVPAQREAVHYLEKMAKKFSGPLRIGGHSKGGNLAVYAASFCSRGVRKRITEIYCNDAPGFSSQVIASEGYLAIQEKIISFVPESSVVGMLFEHGDNYTVVKSTQTGLLQHDIYSWEVAYNDVIRLNRVNRQSRFIDRTIKEWISGLDKEQRQGFAEALYTILSSTEASSIPELTAGWFKSATRMIQSLTNINEASRDMVFKTIGVLFQAAKNNIDALLPPSKKRSARKKNDALAPANTETPVSPGGQSPDRLPLPKD